jgi:outer membrane protein OmpA-like peptidoglycan-associated protein
MKICAATIPFLVLVLGGCAMGNSELIREFESYGLNAQETARGVVVYLPNLYFEFDDAGLTSEAREKVTDLASVLNNRRVNHRSVAVEGHTDSQGDPAYNQSLSLRRAEGVSETLVFSQVAPDRIIVKGYGERFPVASNATPTSRIENRRVEVLAVNIGKAYVERE